MGEFLKELIRPGPLGGLCLLLSFVLATIWLEAFKPPFVIAGHIIFLYGAAVLSICGLLLLLFAYKKQNICNPVIPQAEDSLRLSAQALSDDVEIFERERAVLFYDEIAPIYDSRLTRDYYDTIRAIEREILTHVDRGMNVIDIGGGTGVLFRRFELDERVSWTYVDPSKGMHQRFSELYSGISTRLTILFGSFKGCKTDIRERSYDIAVISFVLSSFPDAISWSDIRETLNKSAIV